MRDGPLNKATDGRRLQQAPAAPSSHPSHPRPNATGTGYSGRPTSGPSGLPARAPAATKTNARAAPQSPLVSGRAAQMVGFLSPFTKESRPSPSSSSSKDIRLQRKQKSSSPLSIEVDKKDDDADDNEHKLASKGPQETHNGEPMGKQHNQRQLKAKLGDSNKLDDDDKNGNRDSKINYWHYKQTGIKSRPIKLLKHPIEHIERKIILTYLLGFLFKFIAIITGPLIVLIGFLMTVPFVVLRRTAWFILNLTFTFDARIKTMDDDDLSALKTRLNSLQNNDSSENQKVIAIAKRLDKQMRWHYCPFNYLESYWFKEKLVNTVIMLVNHHHHHHHQVAPFPVDNFKCLVRDQLLSKPAYRKFLSHVVKRGLPFYKSYYWRYLGLAATAQSDPNFIIGSQPPTDHASFSDSNSSLASSSSSSHSSSSSCSHSLSSIPLNPPVHTTTGTSHPQSSVNISMGPTDQPPMEQKKEPLINLDEHIFIDTSLGPGGASRSTIRRYARQLIGTKLANMNDRPLWEIRLVPASSAGKSYLIFRCHQSLADGKSLASILTSNLTGSNLNLTNTGDGEQEKDGNVEDDDDEDDENTLSPIKEKPSFVESVSRQASLRSAILVGPLTVLLWVIWTFTRRKDNHLNKRSSLDNEENHHNYHGRFYMSQYSLTKIHQIKQMTRSTVCDVILCALSGALRDYLRKFNGVTNPPNLNISLAVDMRQDETRKLASKQRTGSGEKDLFRVAGSAIAMENVDRETTPGVNCTLINVPLPTSVEGTVPRLWELRNTMDELRHSADPWVMLGLQQFLFNLMPIAWYQWLINRIALRNSSTIVSNIRGPQNLVETWCVDLLQRAILESQRAPRTIQTDPTRLGDHDAKWNKFNGDNDNDSERGIKANRRRRRQLAKAKEVKFLQNLGSISELYYCMQPPTSDIPISFNCITYHDKLFLSALSRTLLVEDAKLLIRLFIRQLDQLADTIAKRRNLVTIIRTPIPIEINCQPASPQASALQSPVDIAQKLPESPIKPEDHDTDEIGTSIEAPYFEQEAATIYRNQKDDDLEANLGGAVTSERKRRRCKDCNQLICTCKRRRSLFSFDPHQRQHNLLSLLIPSNLMGSRSRSSEGQDGNQPVVAPPIECLCGQQLLEEMDEESDLVDRRDGASSAGSRTPSDDGGRSAACQSQSRPASSGAGGSDRPYCSRCKLLSKRSTLSLDDDKLQGDNDFPTAHNQHDIMLATSPGGSSPKLDRNRSDRTAHSSAQLNVPKGGSEFVPKAHSKSETDLLPTSKSDKSLFKGDNQRGFKDSSWFTMGGKLSMFTKSNQSSQNHQRRSMSPRGSSAAHMGSSQEAISKTRHRNLIEMPTGIESGNKYNSAISHQQSKRRRQSVATTTGASHIHRSVIVKDKVNADVSLRLDSPFLGIRNRRFSVIGNAVAGSQRRGSLLPFGLIQNQSLPKLFWDDGEAHL